MKKLFFVALLTSSIASISNAADTDSNFKFLLGGGATIGRQAELTTSGSAVSDGRLKSVGTEGYGGIEYRWSDRLFLINTLGYHVSDARFALGSTVHLTSIPFDGIALYGINDQIRLGGGVEVAGHPELAAGSTNLREKYKTSPGLIVEGEYLFTPHMGLALRYVAATYKANNGGEDIKANHAGVLFNYYF